MSKPVRFRAAASAIVLATMISGCTAQQKFTGYGGTPRGEVGLATRALAALNSNDVAQAIDLAERAVAQSPNDAGFRTLLGNAYFQAGRFKSAEAAYKDSLTLVSDQPEAVLKLALVEIAQGKNDQAVAFLTSARGTLDPANYGLALALAGRVDEAISVLEPAARQPGADGRIRQNLALAYGLSGDWTEARTVASQDVAASQLDTRIHQWMLLAKPVHPSDQVAALVGVKPATNDAGQPVRLALRQTDLQVAEAAPAVVPAPQPQIAEAAPVAVPAPVEAAPIPVPAPEPVVAETPAPPPVSVAMMAAASPEAPAAFAAFMPKPKAAPKPAAKPRRVAAAPAFHHGNSNAVMQLGSYRTPQQVAAGWARLTARYPALRGYLPMKARFDSSNGTFWRLSIQGFDSQREAMSRCAVLRNHGGQCFVRGAAGDAPVQIASR
jgi:Flp pilus assembly protein TadD